jgi:hypothetical protein
LKFVGINGPKHLFYEAIVNYLTIQSIDKNW